MSKNVLILFTKNPELGKVKTRLASTVGDEKALEIYNQLLDYTRDIAEQVAVQKDIYYAWSITENDRWSRPNFIKKVQVEGDLGAKMLDAFMQSFQEGKEKVVIIGSDCAEIHPTDIEKAYQALENNDVVIGPALDGGYYLLGMNYLIPEIFTNKPWSQEELFDVTTKELKSLQKTVHLLSPKSDIDYEEDWNRPNYLNGGLHADA